MVGFAKSAIGFSTTPSRQKGKDVKQQAGAFAEYPDDVVVMHLVLASRW